MSNCNILSPDLSPCDLSPCIKSIIGVEKQGASSSDMWILDLKDGNESLPNVFLKLFISTTQTIVGGKIVNIPPPFAELSNHKYTVAFNELLGMQYELQVYRDLITPIVLGGVCPNFLHTIKTAPSSAEGTGCDYVTLLNMLSDKKLTDGTGELVTDKKLINEMLVRNIFNILFETWSHTRMGHMSLKSKLKIPTTIQSMFTEQLVYNFIITPYLKTHMDVLKWYKSQNKHGNVRRVKLDKQDWYTIFQIVAGAYTMNLLKLNHNDLHLENVLVNRLNSPKTVRYIIKDGKTVVVDRTFQTSEVPLIFDWDLAYSEIIGESPRLKNTCEEKPLLCNKYTVDKDILLFFASLFMHTKSPSQANDILEMFAGNHPETIAEIQKLSNKKERIEYFYSEKFNMKKCNTAGEMLQYIDSLLGDSDVNLAPTAVYEISEKTVKKALEKYASDTRLATDSKRPLKPCPLGQEQHPATNSIKIPEASCKVSRKANKKRASKKAGKKRASRKASRKRASRKAGKKRASRKAGKKRASRKASRKLKPCPSGKERNPATNRCRKIQSMRKSRKKVR